MKRFLLAAAVVVLLPVGAAQAQDRFGLGMRVVSQGRSTNTEDVAFRGGGFQASFRPWQRWSFDLSFDALHARWESGAVDASALQFLAGVRWYLFPRPDWNLYLLGALGGGSSRVTFLLADGRQDEDRYAETLFHFGAGLEYRLGRFGLAAELRAVAISGELQEDDLEGHIVGGIGSGGVQANFGGTFYF